MKKKSVKPTMTKKEFKAAEKNIRVGLQGMRAYNSAQNAAFFKRVPNGCTFHVHLGNLKDSIPQRLAKADDTDFGMIETSALSQAEMVLQEAIRNAIDEARNAYVAELNRGLEAEGRNDIDADEVANTVVVSLSDEINPIFDAMTLSGDTVETSTKLI